MNEQKAIRLCLRHRDPAGFAFLVKTFRREAFYHAQALLGNEADAADACQDAFSSAFGAMPSLNTLDCFYPWFYRILHNRCLNLLARRRTRQNYAAAQQEEPQETARSPGDYLEAREEREQVWQHLLTLSSKHREILTLKYIHDFSYAQIAGTLDIPRGTVMSRLYDARAAFRKGYARLQDH